ncbi:acetate permease [Burkholderia pseudomallei]|nr:acetate permease [Burkholderia pseudomallei]CAJ9733913.1 acetate permease [Burkholderia pseudomallei]
MCPTTARDDVGVARLPVRPSRGCRALAPGAQVGREGGGTAAGRASYASHAMAPRVLGGSHGFAVPADRADGDGGRTLANRRPSAILTPPSRRAAEPPSRRAAEPPSRRTAEPPNRRTAEPPSRRTAEPPNRRTAEPPNRRTAEPPNRRAAEPQNRRTAEPQNRRTAEPQWPCNIEKSGAAGSSGGASRGTGAWPGRRAGVDPFDGARRCLRYWRQSKPSHPSNTNARPKPHHPNPRPTRPTGHPR